MRDTRRSSLQTVRRAAGLLDGAAKQRAAVAVAPRASFERLEDRRLMALTTPIITEFLAVNDGSIQDEDGNRSDWIEIYNPTPADINLDGYFLTDDATDPDRWRFPATTIESGRFLIVWASGKDRAVAGQPLHTNFSLDGAGEYLALVAPDAATKLTEFAPTFPQQVSDISYGVSVTQTVTPLVGPNATARTKVPVAGDAALGTSWTGVGFTDTSWTAGRTGVGYETDSPPPANPGFRVRMVDVAPGTSPDIQTINDALAILDSADGTAGGRYARESENTVVKTVINMGSGGSFGADQTLPSGVLGTEMYALRANSIVTIPAGQWTINVNSDDGFRLRIPGATFLTPNNGELPAADTFQYPGLRGASNSFATFTVPAGGLTANLQLDFFENAGGDSVELSIASGHRTSFSTANFQLLGNGVLGWTASDPVTVGPPNYRSLIGTDIQAQAYNINTSAWVRVPFSIPNANNVDSLRLQMKYDDGFVAYLNGTEVARRNAPAALPWDAAASANRDDALAIVYESISIPATALRSGSNVLAIHALNGTRNSTDMLVYPELQGFSTVVGTESRYYATPTPNAVNNTTPAQGVVLDTKFSVDRGFFDAPFQLEITTVTAGAQIRYTTNGQPPTATTGTVYTGPITVDRTTTIRAAAYVPGFVSSNVDTQTYLFLDDVLLQSPNVAPAPGWPAANTRVNNQVINYGMDPDIVNSAQWGPQLEAALKSIPTFSIVTDAKNLWDPATGIYVNPGGDGKPWERPASVELINPDGTKGFQIDAGLRIRGGYSRSTDNPKHAFRLFFGKDYDGDLKYPLFGDAGASQFDGIDLRSTQNYSWHFGGDRNSIFMRDQFSRDTQLAMGQPAERGKWYHLYLNGQYWGLFNTDERPEANYGADYFGGQPEDYDVIKSDPDLGYNIEATDGNMDAWNSLYNTLRGTVNDDVYQLVQGKNSDGTDNPTLPVLLDVDNLIDYMLVIYYGGNLDAPISAFLGNESPNNFFALRNRTLSARQGFSFYAHDAEHTLLNVNENRLGPSAGIGWNAGNTGVNKSNPQWFFQRLWASPEFKLRVADHVQKHMVNIDGALMPAQARERLLARKREVERATIAESARWGDSKTEPPITRNDFENAFANVLNNYIPARTGVVVNQLRQWGLMPAVNAPRYSQQGGQVAIGYQLTITAAAGQQIWYTLDGSDPRARGGAVAPGAILYTGPITINDTTRVRARALSGAVWSPVNDATFSIDLAAIRITEVMYHPADPPPGSPWGDNAFEYIEVMNTGPTPRLLTGMKLAGAPTFTFPTGFTLQPGQRTVVVANRAAFESRYGNAVNIAGEFAGALNNNEDTIRLESPTGQVVLNFIYKDSWYPQTDGEGFSLNIRNPLGAPISWNDKQAWYASNFNGGSPGAPDTGPTPGTVIVNEVLTTPEAGSPTGDFIELRNTTGAPIDVSGWFLSDDALNLKKFQIPAGTTLAANGYLSFAQGQLGFDMTPAAGTVYVSGGDAAGNLLGYRESARFGPGEEGLSYGEYVKATGTDFVALQAPTPGAPNGAPRVGPVVINEIMYHPATGRPEYVELRNLTGTDVVLNDPANPAAAWKLAADATTFVFPAGTLMRVPAFGYAILVFGTADSFTADMPPGVLVYATGQPAGTNALVNTGANITLSRPGAQGDVLVDRVNYTNAAPWPGARANGTGKPISREDSGSYGNEAANWDVEIDNGSPGRVNFDEQAPTVDVVDVSPDPRQTAVSTITLVFSEPVRNLTLADVRLTRDDGANLLTGAQTLTSADHVTWTLGGLSSLTGAAGTYTVSVLPSFDIQDWLGFGMEIGASDTWRVGGAPEGRVVGRHIFYNNSSLDGASEAADDGAVATDKRALLPGQTATFANYTSYSRGINGVMVDVAGLLANLTAADFRLDVGYDVEGEWIPAPAPASVTRRTGVGTNNSDRVTLTWADGVIRDKWLRVTLLANANTRLPTADVFYFGNLGGEVGNSTTGAAVTAADVLAVRANIGRSGVGITDPYDFNRDRRVNTTDLAIARANAGSLTLLTVPAASPAAPAPTGTVSVASTTTTATVPSDTTLRAVPVTTTTVASPTTTTTVAPSTRTAPRRATVPFSETAIASIARTTAAKRSSFLADLLGQRA